LKTYPLNLVKILTADHQPYQNPYTSHKIKIFLDFYKIIFDNLKMTLVDTCLFGNVNEKGAIKKIPDT